jgi:heme A synthase
MHLLVTLVVVGLILWLLWWFVSYVGLPEPFNKVARVIIALIAVIFLIGLLLNISGVGFSGTGHTRLW